VTPLVWDALLIGAVIAVTAVTALLLLIPPDRPRGRDRG
jgi:hypothetical protein